MAGVAIGLFTPGFIADANLANQPAEVGIILLMFGVGLHFSVSDLLAVRRIALPGALTQIVAATTIGAGIAFSWGWNPISSIVFGLALSCAMGERELALGLLDYALKSFNVPEQKSHAIMQELRKAGEGGAFERRFALELSNASPELRPHRSIDHAGSKSLK